MKPTRPVAVRRRAAQFGLLITGCMLLIGLVPFLVPGRLARDPTMSASPVQAAARDTFHIEQPLVLSRMPLLTLERATVTVSNARAGVAVAQLLLDQPMFVLATAVATDAKSAPYGPDRVSPLIAQLAALGFKQISVRNGSLRIVTPAAEPTAAATPTTLSAIEAQIATDGRGSVIAGGRFVARGEAVSFDMTAGPAVAADQTAPVAAPAPTAGDGPQRRALRAALDSARLGELRFDGYLQGGVRLEASGNTQVRAKDAAALLRWLGVAVGDGARAPLMDVTGDVHWADGQMAFKTASVTFGPRSAATGALTLRHAGARPSVAGTLGFDTLDIAEDTQTGERSRRLDLLAAVDMDLRLSANQVTMAGATFGRAAASVSVRDGVVTADVADLEWSGARVAVQVTADLTAPDRAVQARGRLSSSEARDVTLALTGRPLFAGALALNFDVKGADCGLPIDPRRCEGKLALTGQSGARGAIDLARLAAIADVESAQRKAGPLPLHAAPAPLDAVDMRMTLTADGVAVDQGQIRAGEASFGVGGRIDLTRGTLHLLATRQPAAKSAAKKAPPREGQPAVLAIGGTLAAPTIAPAPQP